MVIGQFGSQEVYLKTTKDQPAAPPDRFLLDISLEQWFQPRQIHTRLHLEAWHIPLYLQSFLLETVDRHHCMCDSPL